MSSSFLDFSLLNEEQNNAISMIRDWFTCASIRPFFKLGGLAGCGKTFIIRYIMDVLKLNIYGDVAFCAFTGKASLVMIGKGLPATTIHKLIYDYEKDDETGKIKYTKRSALPDYIKLIVVDEASMVSEKIHNDLMSFKIPILYIGDYGQLESIEMGLNLMDEDGLDVMLTEIQRNSGPIVKLAMDVRNGKRIKYGNLGDGVFKVRYKDLKGSSFKAADQIICGMNKTRHKINDRVRGILGYSGLPMAGEKLIILKNNKNFDVINGQHIYLKEDMDNGILFSESRITDHLSDNLNESIDDIIDKIGKNEQIIDFLSYENLKNSMNATVPISLREFKDVTVDKGNNEDMELVQADYGYCISCHKSQGSEFDKVLICDDGFLRWDEEQRTKWLYTAITRAKSKLIWSVM